ncbi:hypothetical protein SAMN04488024_101583 [Pedobacter soli]|uniref:Uncharacterized protein n=1 Tax=Pedobacter soli TaxID=390242 RepID=A0A1G6JXY2_9SPHI|nr:hypothetical protein SAMN04488024_101583 [Pedobacter soli]
MTTEQTALKKLIKQRDLFKGLLIGACILWPIILSAAVYFYYKKNNTALFIPVCTMVAIFLPVYLRLNALNAEVKSRQQG